MAVAPMLAPMSSMIPPTARSRVCEMARYGKVCFASIRSIEAADCVGSAGTHQTRPSLRACPPETRGSRDARRQQHRHRAEYPGKYGEENQPSIAVVRERGTESGSVDAGRVLDAGVMYQRADVRGRHVGQQIRASG